MKIRFAEPTDAKLCAEWSVSTKHNGFNREVAESSVITWVIEDDNGPVLFVPAHPVLVIESAAARPDITPRQYIEALLEAKRETEATARQLSMREVHTSSAYQPMIRTLHRHGYVNIPGTALRKRIA